MSADAQSLLEKYKPDNEAASTAADVHRKIQEMPKPDWSKYEATSSLENYLSELQPAAGGIENKAAFLRDHTNGRDSTKACMAVMWGIKDEAAPLQYILTVLYDMLREDSACFGIFEEALKSGCDVYKPLLALLQRSSSDPNWAYVADKGAWLLSAIIGHEPRFFTEEDVKGLLTLLMAGTCCSELGTLEAVTNLLKSDSYRAMVWSQAGVPDLVFKVLVEPRNTPSPILYKSIFAIWMVSFDAVLSKTLKSNEVIQKIKAILISSRTEKVIRLCLTVLKNFLAQKANCQEICEDIVECGVLEAVQQLEYEKWRDAELYDDIRELVQLIASEVKELSNFDRYMKELESGTLSWGFIHGSKFFGENVMKFETGEFKAVKLLASLLSSSNATTLAVACHDIGEFVSLHPLGKKQVARLGVKERVMELMGSTDQDKREVRREALLCCQKIMLNKWQDVGGGYGNAAK